MINLQLIKQKPQTSKNQLFHKSILISFVTFIISTVAGPAIAGAISYQEQINQLRSSNSTLQSERSELQSEASDLEAQIAALRTQIADLENQIRANQAQADNLKRQIAEMEAELEKQRVILGENIKAMYLESKISTMEMLASSRNLSDFVDKEQYRVSVEDKIQDSMDKIKELKDSLDAQKSSLDKVISDQLGMQAQLDGQRAAQSRILALNQQQRAELDGNIRANSSKISSLRKQQAAENARLFSASRSSGGVRNVPDSTGYPWANVQPFPNSYSDPWGMYKRQCVSYTAWKVWKSGRHMPYWGGRGNARNWDDNARAAGIPVDSNPRVGDVAVSNSGTYGHVMYVEAVHGDGTISVSQYNASWDGRYSEARIPVGRLVFVHF